MKVYVVVKKTYCDGLWCGDNQGVFQYREQAEAFLKSKRFCWTIQYDIEEFDMGSNNGD